MAGKQNMDPKASDATELDDATLGEANGGLVLIGYCSWTINCFDCGAETKTYAPYGEMPARRCEKCGGTDVAMMNNTV